MTRVYCFSGTGHSLAVAEYCAKVLNAPLFRLPPELPENNPEGKQPEAFADNTGNAPVKKADFTPCSRDTAVVVFPVYCQAIPRPAEVFLRKLPARNVFLIATWGKISHGNVLRYAQKITPSRVCAAAYLPTGHTYLSGDSEKPQNVLDEESKNIPDSSGKLPVSARDTAVDTAALDLLFAADPETTVHIPFSPRHIFAGFLPGTRSRIGIRLSRNASCTGCGKCTAACPFGAMQNGIPGKNCRRCLSCVYTCPQHALTVRVSRVLKSYLRRHTHPDAKAEVFF